MKLEKLEVTAGDVTAAFNGSSYHLNEYGIVFTNVREVAAALLWLADTVDAAKEMGEAP